jgi:hypothetical protein
MLATTWESLKLGQVHIYPEVWLSEERDYYEQYVVVGKSVVAAGPLGILGQNGWYCSEADVEHWPELAGWRGLAETEPRAHFNNTFLGTSSSPRTLNPLAQNPTQVAARLRRRRTPWHHCLGLRHHCVGLRSVHRVEED